MIDENNGAKVRAVAAGIRTGVSDKLGRIWWAFGLRGILAVALGFFALFWPDLGLGILVLAVGLYCIADGAAGLIGAVRYPELRVQLLQSLVIVGIGLLLVFWPGATVRTLLMLLGLAALISGGGQLLTAREMAAQDPERRPIMIIGSIGVVVGLVLLFWPASGATAIAWVIGIAAILIGALLIYLGIRVRRLGTRIGAAEA